MDPSKPGRSMEDLGQSGDKIGAKGAGGVSTSRTSFVSYLCVCPLDDRGMQSQQRLNTSAPADKSPSKNYGPSSKGRASPQAESPYLSRPFSRSKSSQRRLSGTGPRVDSKLPISRPPTAPSPGIKVHKRPSPRDKCVGKDSFRFSSWNLASFRSDRPTSVPVGKAQAGDGGISHRSDAGGNAERESSRKRELVMAVDSKTHREMVCDQSEICGGVWEADKTRGLQNPLEDTTENSKVVGSNQVESVNEKGTEESETGYGMTLGEYMSNMQTTPAATSSVTGLENDKWESFQCGVSIERDPVERRSEEENEAYQAMDTPGDCPSLSEMPASEPANFRCACITRKLARRMYWTPSPKVIIRYVDHCFLL